MIPTYVFGWPSGKENGDYLAVDLGACCYVGLLSIKSNLSCVFIFLTLIVPYAFSSHLIALGGTNLRVCLVTLQGEGKFEITQTKYRLTEEQKQDDGQKLFDFCAECLKTFIDTNIAGENGLQLGPGETLPLGFTVRSFSISLVQLSDQAASSFRIHAR